MTPSPLLDLSAKSNPQPLNGSPAQPNSADNPPQPAAERDAKGRFTKGNPGGPGNPFARQVGKLRSALVNRVTEADMERIAEDLIVKARLGDMAAIKLLFLYVLGKPASAVNPDTLDIEEWVQTIRPIPAIQRELPRAMMTVPVDVLSGMVHIVQPFMIGEAADTFVRSVGTKEQEKSRPDEKTSPRPDNDQARPASSELPSPSTNVVTDTRRPPSRQQTAITTDRSRCRGGWRRLLPRCRVPPRMSGMNNVTAGKSDEGCCQGGPSRECGIPKPCSGAIFSSMPSPEWSAPRSSRPRR
jgi:hypothetical protein